MIFLLKVIYVGLFFLLFSNFGFGQKIDVVNENNKSQMYAVESAKFSREIYLVSQRHYFLNNSSYLKKNIDSLISLSRSAIAYADSALFSSSDSSKTAQLVMIAAKKYQSKVLSYLIDINYLNDVSSTDLVTKQLIYEAGNSCVEAYKASLYFEMKEELYISKDDSINLAEGREITRLEADEVSYMSIKELYGKRLLEIDQELVALYNQVNEKEGNKFDQINKVIEQLKLEKERCVRKIKSSENRLINVRNELSEEMLYIVHKDIFTTDKKGFYNENVPVPVTDNVPDGLVYKLQIGFFKNQLLPENFGGIFPLSSQKIDNTYYRYVAGNFAKYQEAKDAKREVILKGYTDSFIVAYLNGKKISISDALQVEEKE